MVDGLVVTENIALFEELNINFSNEQNHFEYANSAESAKEIIALDVPDYLVIIEKSVEKTERILKQLYVDESIKRIPTLYFLSSLEWMKRGQLWHEGVRDIIRLPITKMELKYQLDSFVSEISDLSFDQEEAGMFGKLEDYNLLDLIQTLENSRKTGVLVLYRSREEGKIWFQEGQIQDAKYRSFEPVNSIFKMVSWLDGDFSITFVDDNYEKTIEKNNQEILLEAIQYIDERNRILNSLPNRNETLLISPESDMDIMDEESVNYLRFFHGGHTISSFLDAFDQDDSVLLGIISEFVENKMLMTRETFDDHFAELEQQAEEAGIKKVFKRFFTRKDEQELKKSTSENQDYTNELPEQYLELQRFQDLQFNFQNGDLDLKKIHSLVEKI
jgi:hypothetical protein